MKTFIAAVLMLCLGTLAPTATYATGGGSGGGSGGHSAPTWEQSFVNCYDPASGTWDTYTQCDAANGTCTDQYCPCP